MVFFSAWLSHVPPQRFEEFWALVGNCLDQDGRVFVIDELPAVVDLERPILDAIAPTVERRLTTGARFRAVKVFFEPEVLAQKLSALGWKAGVHAVDWRFVYATAQRAAGA